jgi:hypothetical protein
MAFTPIDQIEERQRLGFVPLEEIDGDTPSGFVPVDAVAPEKPSVLKTVALNNPLTALIETGANLASQGVALPLAGLAGLATEAAHAAGLTDKRGADVVHAVGDALTYQPRGEMGQAASAAVMYPFEKLHEAATYVGEKTQDATGSPAAATAAHTMIEGVLPLAIGPAVKGAKAAREKFSTRSTTNAEKATADSGSTATEASPQAAGAAEPQARRQGGNQGDAATGYKFVQIDEVANAEAKPVQARAGRLAGDDPQVPRTGTEDVAVLRREGNNGMPGVAGEFRFVPLRYGPSTDAAALARPAGRDAGVLPRELSLDDTRPANEPARLLSEGDAQRPGNDGGAGIEATRAAGEKHGIAPGGTSDSTGVHRAPDRQAGEVDTLPGRAPADSRGGAAPESVIGRAVEQGQGRLAAGAGIDASAVPAPKNARYALIEAKDLKPRNIRSEPDWYQQERIIQDQIVGEFNPNKLAEALDDADGAPIVRRDGSIAAGHKRVEALTRIYQANGAKAIEYRQFIKDNARDFGLDPAAIDGMKKPVLVRVPDESRPAGAEFPPDISPDTNFRRPAPDQAAVMDMAGEVQNGTWNPGANYVPFVDQMRAPEAKAASVADLPAPKRREHIISEFASAIGTTVYEGRVKGDKRLGYFRPKIEEVRTKHANDIEVAGHEVAHLIDFRVPELKKAWSTDKALAAELKSVSYDQKNVREGWAEGMRLWLTQPETLEAKAPRVMAFIEDFANSHEYGKPLRRAQEQMTGWFGQDALNRARSKIGTETPLREYMDRFWDKFRQATVDDLHGIYNMERSMLGEIRANGPYESARTSRASASIADGAVRFGYPVKNPDGSFKFAGKGLEEILQPVSKSIDDALLYFVGRSANELMGQGREHLFTKGEIDAMLKLKTPERAKAFEEYQAWNKGVLDFAEAQGVINPEARALWQRTQYLPFHRVEQPGGIKGKPGDWAGIQALTGGTTNIKDVLGNMIGNAAMLIDRSVKNEARRKVAKLAQMEGGGKFMVKIEPGEKMIKVSGDQVIEQLLKKTGIALDGDAPAFFEFLVKGQPPAGNNVVAVLQGGKPLWFEVGDPILYRALKAIDRPLMNQVVKVLGWPKRVGQLSITATPDFWMANMARDTLMGTVMSRAGFRPILDSIKGMATRMTSDPAYKDYLANGGGLSSIFLDETHLRSKLERYYRDQGIDYRTVLDTPDKLLTFVETLGDAFEMSTRLGEYKRAIAAGENPRHAAYLGREVSTDFAMRGDSKALGFMYDTVMFLKPAVVSWDRLYRGLAHDPNKGAIAAKAGMMAMFSAGLYLLNREDPRYADLPDWDRDANWHFFIGDQHFRWPKIWEIGAMSSAAERSVEKIMDEDPQGLGKDFARILGATFNLNLMPQILAPLYEQGANRNSFTKSPIETPGMEGVQPFLRAKPGTSETMKAAGMATRDNPEWAQVNPVRAEALLRGYFNTWAMYGLMLTDQALYGDKLPEKRTDELPVVRRFYANEPAKHTKHESEFYDLLSEAKRLRGTMRELDDRGLTGYADTKEQSPLAGEAKPLERAAKNLGAINNEMTQVRQDGNLTPRQKRERLDALTVERNALLKAAVQDSKAAQKAKAPTAADMAKRGINQE